MECIVQAFSVFAEMGILRLAVLFWLARPCGRTSSLVGPLGLLVPFRHPWRLVGLIDHPWRWVVGRTGTVFGGTVFGGHPWRCSVGLQLGETGMVFFEIGMVVLEKRC